jgi:hypothetical protein
MAAQLGGLLQQFKIGWLGPRSAHMPPSWLRPLFSYFQHPTLTWHMTAGIEATETPWYATLHRGKNHFSSPEGMQISGVVLSS